MVKGRRFTHTHTTFLASISSLLHLKTQFKVQVSYYEIYNERIFDLLASSKQKSKTKVTSTTNCLFDFVFNELSLIWTQLRVREHPVMGPYVEDLST